MTKLVFKYALFALIATIANLGAQKIVSTAYTGLFSYIIALAIGTLVGLAVKYVLDKRYIFYYQVKSKVEDAKKFGVYTLMGIVTTAVFWGMQTIFFLALPQFADAKYVGGALGLAIGYTIKYNLDKRFVFHKAEEKA